MPEGDRIIRKSYGFSEKCFLIPVEKSGWKKFWKAGELAIQTVRLCKMNYALCMDIVIDISILLDVYGEALGIEWLEEFYTANEQELGMFFSVVSLSMLLNNGDDALILPVVSEG